MKTPEKLALVISQLAAEVGLSATCWYFYGIGALIVSFFAMWTLNCRTSK